MCNNCDIKDNTKEDDQTKHDAEAYNFGNPIFYYKKTNKWTYPDGKENTEENYQKLVCPRCKLCPTKEGHDPCIANLPEVKYACCGHGIKEDYQLAYVAHDDGKAVYFDTTEEILKYVKENFKR